MYKRQDIHRIKQFGLKIADDAILALGDNYAMSADSRVFGFVPTKNLRGSPVFTFWPPRNIGILPQTHTSYGKLPNYIIQTIGFGCLLCVCIVKYRRKKLGYFKRLAPQSK